MTARVAHISYVGVGNLQRKCDVCGWIAGEGFAEHDGWHLSDSEDMCSLCIAESEGRPDPAVQEDS